MKQKFKKIIKSLGLLSFVDWLIFSFSKKNILAVCCGFKFYFYNHWVTNFPNHSIRLFYLRHVIGISIGRNTFIHMECFFEGNNTYIGNNSVIGRNCFLGASEGKLIIKNNVSITAQTYIFCSTHLKDSPVFECVTGMVTIEDRAWVGARAMILPGVRIGKGAILGAASTATKNIPDFTVWAGTPAKKIGVRSRNLKYTLNYFPYLQ